jgi:hypothetical protein
VGVGCVGEIVHDVHRIARQLARNARTAPRAALERSRQ